MTYHETHTHVRVQAYHDGELGPAQAARVEAHLATCAPCREELAALRSLSSLLDTAPPASPRMPEDRFVAQVALRLRRRPERTPVQQALLTGWRLIPAGLVATWLFFQTAALLTTGITALLALGIGTETLGAVVPPGGTGPGWAGELGSIIPVIVGLLTPEVGHVVQGTYNTLVRLGTLTGVANLIAPLGIGLFLWSWLASWLVSKRSGHAAGD